MNEEYVKKSDVKKMIKEIVTECYDGIIPRAIYSDLMEEMKFLPKADVVEVIRCEHCLHWDDEIENEVYVGPLYHRCDYTGEHKDACNFCSDAERRTNND